MSDNQNKSTTLTPGQRKILETVKNELFPQIENLKKLIVNVQACRISYQLFSFKLQNLEKEYATVSKRFFEVVKKLETPDILFEGIEGEERNIVDYFQFQGAFKQNIGEGLTYVEIIDRTLDRKAGTIQNNRTFLISIIAIVVSIYYANNSNLDSCLEKML
jgi:hypothetical protein